MHEERKPKGTGKSTLLMLSILSSLNLMMAVP